MSNYKNNNNLFQYLIIIYFMSNNNKNKKMFSVIPTEGIKIKDLLENGEFKLFIQANKLLPTKILLNPNK